MGDETRRRDIAGRAGADVLMMWSPGPGAQWSRGERMVKPKGRMRLYRNGKRVWPWWVRWIGMLFHGR